MIRTTSNRLFCTRTVVGFSSQQAPACRMLPNNKTMARDTKIRYGGHQRRGVPSLDMCFNGFPMRGLYGSLRTSSEVRVLTSV